MAYNTNKSIKKEKTVQAIAKAKQWAEKRRKSNNTTTSGSSTTTTSAPTQHKQQHKKDVYKIAKLQAMLMKEKEVLAEAQLRVQLIENELKRINIE